VSVFSLFADAVTQINESVASTQTSNHAKAIVLALNEYRKKHGSYPPAAICGADGKPLLSWRVAILPHIEGQEFLYRQFHLDEPWDSPHNRTLLADYPVPVYQPVTRCRAPVDPTLTCWQAFVGPGAAFEGNSGLRVPEDFPLGLAQTVLIVETRETVPWTKPVDITFGDDQPIPELGTARCGRIGQIEHGPYSPISCAAAMADGTVRRIPIPTPPERLRPWIDRTAVVKPDLD
jgi:hypothetical protein